MHELFLYSSYENKVFRVSHGSTEGYDLSKKKMPQNSILSYQLFSKPIIASYITFCIMRSFLSQIERTPKGKVSVINKHVTCDLLFFN